ncbi:MAG: methyl-accepting chemotaxis protein [Acidimicrobiales bacterium]
MGKELEQTQRADIVPGQIDVSDSRDVTMLAYCGITTETLGLVAHFNSELNAAIPEMAEVFYAQIKSSHVAGVLEEFSSEEKQRPILVSYLESLFDGVVDDSYIENRRSIGLAHDRVGLDPISYFGQYNVIMKVASEAIVESGESSSLIAEVLAAVASLVAYDSALATEAYVGARDARVAVMDKTRAEQSTGLELASADMAAASEETLASAEEMRTQCDDLATNAASVRDTAVSMGQIATEGGELVDDVARQISEAKSELETVRTEVRTLAEDAVKIEDIVGLIRGIAAQTNLLALNAAIEAARAGDAGRGFAVVASEVKELAASTAESLDGISGLITGMNRSVAGVVGSVDRTSESVEASSERAASAVDSLVVIGEQAGVTEQMATAMASASTSMVSVTDEIQGAASSVASQAETLTGLAADMATAG